MTNAIDIYKLPNREFSFFCEFQVAFELQRKGWQVYQPLIDRYIDLIAVKNGSYRTIQVKSSRIENLSTLSYDGYESYGLTMKPKDLFHDTRHFYIWAFTDKNLKFHYFIFNVKDFIDIRYYKLPHSSRRKYPSLLMRGEWRWGTDRLHPHHYIIGKNIGKWEVEGVELNEYEDQWNKLETIVTDESYNFECINATELDETWKDVNKEILEKWKQSNKYADEKIKSYPEIYDSSQRLLLRETSENEGGIIDAHLFRLTENDAKQIFKETEENWEVFLPLEKTDHVLLFRPICSQYGKFWNTSLKECFYCKTKYYRVKICEKCGHPYPENVKPLQKCADCGGNIVKRCITCGKVEKGRNRIFVPITFCWYCGNRQNKFDFKIVSIEKR
uniref:Uncharacterized protein n=1 Tax=candidate division WOR-3 bacterium TaxID=2052148 RepID=A0A7C4XLW3_UNCW3